MKANFLVQGILKYRNITFLIFAGLFIHSAHVQGEIQQIDLVHFSHTDIGFTDHPSVCRELYRRYLNIALDTILDSMDGPIEKRFYWTAESTVAVNDWWQAASPERQQLFLKAVKSGQLDITALACNNTPFLNQQQWQRMVEWLPDQVWQQVKPQVAVQNDVNGFPRAGAMALLDRGVRHLFTGINEDSGGSPFARPSAFWWKMPDGRRLFVWLNIGYGSGFDFFEPQEWRRGPVPNAADARYRPPRAGEILSADADFLRKAHGRCVEAMRRMEKGGYKYPVVAISITSQWRFDNDPPFPPLADFVAAWNRMELKPLLRLTSVTDAMKRLESVMGDSIPEHQGEWTDWWANGTASGPREVAASRWAKRFLDAAQSPIWGPLSLSAQKTINELYQELCLFDEHTWGSSMSVALPYSLDTLGQFNEKSALAFRPMARAEWLLSQRLRSRLIREGEGLWIANPTKAPYSGWARMISTCLRDDFKSLEDTQTGRKTKIYFEPGIQPWGRPQNPSDLSREDISATFPDQVPGRAARFWVENLPPVSMKRFALNKQSVESDSFPTDIQPIVQLDDQGWPVSLTWPGMKKPLFLKGYGDFIGVSVNAFAPRWTLADIRGQRGEARTRMRQEKLVETKASAEGHAQWTETPHTLIYSQWIRHPRLQWARRVLEIWKREPRARLTVKINRLSSAAPEIYYIACPLPTGQVLPKTSSGGMSFVPFQDQLANTCRDYFAIDGWVDYATPEGYWLWVSRDAPLISFGDSPTLANLKTAPDDINQLRAMIYNNFWYTNFLGDSPGIMEFQFDLAWRKTMPSNPQDEADTLVYEPLMMINPGVGEDPRVIKNLYQP